MICGIVSQNFRCIAGAFGIYTGILHLYICKYVQITHKKYTLSPFCEHNRQKNRHLSGYDQITFIGDDVPTRK